jgi:hypothetical protein
MTDLISRAEVERALKDAFNPCASMLEGQKLNEALAAVRALTRTRPTQKEGRHG